MPTGDGLAMPVLHAHSLRALPCGAGRRLSRSCFARQGIGLVPQGRLPVACAMTLVCDAPLVANGRVMVLYADCLSAGSSSRGTVPFGWQFRNFAHREKHHAEVLLAVILGTTVLIGASKADQPPAEVPLDELTAADGQTPKIERQSDGFHIADTGSIEATVKTAADAFLCRTGPAALTDVVQLSIGRVDSLRCNCLYSPSRDEAICFEADRVELSSPGGRFHLKAQGPLTVRVEKNYMKLKRGLAYFRPLDQKAFSRAPAGWCSWYVFYQGIREDQVVQNTDWLAANLKKFGCQYVQIDDGWQGVGQGSGENRDWYVTEKHKFPHGMKWLADYIRGKGFGRESGSSPSPPATASCSPGSRACSSGGATERACSRPPMRKRARRRSTGPAATWSTRPAPKAGSGSPICSG